MRGLICLLLVFAVVACGQPGGQETTTTASVENSAPTTSSVSPSPPESTSVPVTTVPVTTGPAATVPTGAFVISIVGEAIEGGGRLEVALGDEVTIRVESDFVDEAHLHGYDIHADVGPGASGEFSFEATIPGIFELELEDSRILLGELVVS